MTALSLHIGIINAFEWTLDPLLWRLDKVLVKVLRGLSYILDFIQLLEVEQMSRISDLICVSFAVATSQVVEELHLNCHGRSLRVDVVLFVSHGHSLV